MIIEIRKRDGGIVYYDISDDDWAISSDGLKLLMQHLPEPLTKAADAHLERTLPQLS